MNNKFMKFLVNFITVSRIIFSLFFILLSKNINYNILLVLIIILFLTDFIDGFLARKFNVQTLFGSILDTLADKILSIVLIIPLLKENNILYLIVVGEIIIAIINIRARFRRKLTRVCMFGKIKMWLLSITIIFLYLNLFYYISNSFTFLLIVVTFIFQLIVTVYYIFYLRKQSDRKTISINKYNYIYILFDTEYYLKNS